MGRERLSISAWMPSISETLTLALGNLGGGMHRYGAAHSGFPPPLSTTVAGCHHWTFLLQLSAISEAPKMLFLEKSF